MDSGRGGRRLGAGRKPKRGEPTDTVITRVKRSNRTWLMEEAERTGKTTGELLDEAIEALRNKGIDKE